MIILIIFINLNFSLIYDTGLDVIKYVIIPGVNFQIMSIYK